MGVEVTYPGVYVEEIESGVRRIEGVATSITAFAGWAAKGPTELAEPVSSWKEFENVFGGLDARSLLGYSVSHFFENGGSKAYILRIADPESSNGSVLCPNEPAFENALLPSDGESGLYHLDQIDLFNLLCVPGETNERTITQLQQFCRERRAFLIVDCPKDAQFASMANGPGDLIGDDAMNSALYFPWVRAADPPQGSEREFPPCGFVAGIYARTDATRGVWKAPAGISATVKGSTGIAPEKKITDSENGVLNPKAINCVRSFPTYGTVVWGARTLHGTDALASDWKYVPVRRLALFIEESIDRGLKWVVFEPNDEPLWAQIRLNIGDFMYSLFRQGAFLGTTPKDAYFVKCDSATTTQNDIDNGVVNILIGFAPLKPAEFVIIRIQQMASQSRTTSEDPNKKEITMSRSFTRNANRFDPYKNFKFRVKWDGRAAFSREDLDQLDAIVDQAADPSASGALFVGARGTGKTMAAEIIASRLASDLQRVDLDAIVSEYIGETEKNLQRLFEEAAKSGTTLFFDEADALFGKRSDVKDSHDRYANLEVGYLMERVEEFRRPVIFATNLKENIDPAFIRRLRYIVYFPMPDDTK